MPKYSVIVPSYNRAHLIGRSIESILAQTFKDFEIIVIDDGSQDETKEVLKSYAGKIRYYFQENRGVSAARNHGIIEAKGEYLAFTDDDVITDQNWLVSLDYCFQETRCDVIGGRVLPIFPDETPLWVRNNPAKISGGVVIYDYGPHTHIYDRSFYGFIAANLTIRKKVLDECGSFREDLKFDGRIALGEDIEIIDRMQKKNKVLYYCGQALVYHPVYMNRLTLRHAARWNTAWGRFCARQDWEDKDKKFVYLCDAPRYLWRGVIIDFLKLCTSIFNHLALYDACRKFFRKIGMIREYRRIIRERKKR